MKWNNLENFLYLVLNGWDKKVYHKDMIFVLVDRDNNRWLSPIFE